jgi:hypothetical protein
MNKLCSKGGSYTVKNVKWFPRPQPGCHLPNSPLLQSKAVNLFTVCHHLPIIMHHTVLKNAHDSVQISKIFGLNKY